MFPLKYILFSACHIIKSTTDLNQRIYKAEFHDNVSALTLCFPGMCRMRTIGILVALTLLLTLMSFTFTITAYGFGPFQCNKFLDQSFKQLQNNQLQHTGCHLIL